MSDQAALFDAPRIIPPGSFFAVRRTDGEEMFGEYGWAHTDSPDDWAPAERDAETLEGQFEYELVMLVPKRIAVRTIAGGQRYAPPPARSTAAATRSTISITSPRSPWRRARACPSRTSS
jgi:hypothetical protein